MTFSNVPFLDLNTMKCINLFMFHYYVLSYNNLSILYPIRFLILKKVKQSTNSRAVMKLGKSINQYTFKLLNKHQILWCHHLLYSQNVWKEYIHICFVLLRFYNSQHTYAFLHSQILECLFLMWTISLSLWCRRVFLSTGTSFYFFLHIGMHPTRQSLYSINLQMH